MPSGSTISWMWVCASSPTLRPTSVAKAGLTSMIRSSGSIRAMPIPASQKAARSRASLTRRASSSRSSPSVAAGPAPGVPSPGLSSAVRWASPDSGRAQVGQSGAPSATVSTSATLSRTAWMVPFVLPPGR